MSSYFGLNISTVKLPGKKSFTVDTIVPTPHPVVRLIVFVCAFKPNQVKPNQTKKLLKFTMFGRG